MDDYRILAYTDSPTPYGDYLTGIVINLVDMLRY